MVPEDAGISGSSCLLGLGAACMGLRLWEAAPDARARVSLTRKELWDPQAHGGRGCSAGHRASESLPGRARQPG